MLRLSAVGIAFLPRDAGALQGKVGEDVKVRGPVPPEDASRCRVVTGSTD